MSKPFDAVTKHLIEAHPMDWLRLIGIPADRADVIDADVSSVTAAGDKVIRVRAPAESLVNLELQASYDADLPDRKLLYHVLLRRRHKLPVRSVAILLRPAANGSAMTGELRYTLPDGAENLVFRYGVIRVWELDPRSLISGGTATAPLAPLANVKRVNLKHVIRDVVERLRDELPRDEAAEHIAATYVLLGLRYTEAMAERLFEGVQQMTESVTYQAILRKGRKEGEARGEARGKVEQAHDSLFLVGTEVLGEPGPDVRTAIESITELPRLKSLTRRAVHVRSWEELLAE